MDQEMKLAAPSCHHEQAIPEIARGRELMDLLQDLLLRTTPSDHRSEHAAILIKEAQQACTAALSSLQACRRSQSCSHPAATQVGATCANDHASKYSDKKRKISLRGDKTCGHGRRREESCKAFASSHYCRSPQSSCLAVTSNPHYDGYEWRKFGQKTITGSKYPRSYYRCANRDDQGCQATKRVQQMDDGDPPKYTVNYIMQHICKTTENIPPVVMNSTIRNGPVLGTEDNSLKSLAAEDQNNDCMILSKSSEVEVETTGAEPDMGAVISNEFSHASLFELDMEWMNDGFGWIA